MKKPDMDAMIAQMTKELADQGKLIEAGWLIFRHMALPPHASAVQIDGCRIAYLSGAQHLYASMMKMLDPGAEPTQADERRLDLINAELNQFANEMRARAGLG